MDRSKPIHMQTIKIQPMLTVHEVSAILGVKDVETAMRWLKVKGITIYHELKTKKVFAFDVAVVFDLALAKDLKRKYPTNWKQIYHLIATDDAVRELVMIELCQDEVIKFPSSKLSPRNDAEEELIKKLLQK